MWEALGKILIQVVAKPLHDFGLGVGHDTRVVEAKRNLARVHPFGAAIQEGSLWVMLTTPFASCQTSAFKADRYMQFGQLADLRA
jgi:hypothetical protein